MEEGGGLYLDDARRYLFRALRVAGAVIMLFFALQMVEKGVLAVDIAGPQRGVTVSVGERTATVPTIVRGEDGEYGVVEREVTERETVTLHGVSAWSLFFAAWLAPNALYLVLGAVLYAAAFVMTPKRREVLSAALLKQKLIGSYLAFTALLILVTGVNRIFFLPHEPLTTFLYKLDWYVMEFLSQVIWGLVLAVLAAFYLASGRYGALAAQEGTGGQEKREP